MCVCISFVIVWSPSVVGTYFVYGFIVIMMIVFCVYCSVLLLAMCAFHFFSLSIFLSLLFASLFLFCFSKVCVCIATVAVICALAFFFSLVALFNISMKIRTNYFQFELNTAIALQSMWCMRAFVYVQNIGKCIHILYLWTFMILHCTVQLDG